MQATRRASRETLRTQVGHYVEQILAELETGLDELRRASPPLALYPSSPVPEAPNEAQALYEKALASPAAEIDALFSRIEMSFPDALSPSGLPLFPLVKWARLERAQPAAMPEKAEALARSAVEFHPSALSRELLERAARLLQENSLDRSGTDEWIRRWDDDEKARAVLRENERTLATTPLPAWLENGAWWVERSEGDGPLRIIGGERLQEMAATVMARTSGLQPAYAAVDIRLAGVPLEVKPVAGEHLAALTRSGFDVVGVLARPRMLDAQQRQQVTWLAALLACAVATAIAGYGTMQKALSRERQLNVLKSNFVASISHELRAPVASMRVMAENLGSGIITDQVRRSEYHRLIAEECWRLSTLIENVLDLARIEQDRTAYHFAETEISALVKDVVLLMKASAGERRQLFASEISPFDKPPICDGLAVQRALINLIDNASKFSPPETAITVRAAPCGSDQWELSVRDQGSGIPTSEHGRIFKRFYRIGSELRRETKGAGIGLSIVRHIAEGHGGGVTVESAPGTGSQFTLRLPLVPPASSQPLESDVPNPRC